MRLRALAIAALTTLPLVFAGPAVTVAAANPDPVTTSQCSLTQAKNTRTGTTYPLVDVRTCVNVTTYFDDRPQPYRVVGRTYVSNNGTKPLRRLVTTTHVRKNEGSWYARKQERDKLAAGARNVLVGSKVRWYTSGTALTKWQAKSHLTFRIYFPRGGWRYYKASGYAALP